MPLRRTKPHLPKRCGIGCIGIIHDSTVLEKPDNATGAQLVHSEQAKLPAPSTWLWLSYFIYFEWIR